MSNERLIEYLIEDVREVKKDVKDILRFKWQIMGGSAVLSILVGLAIQVAMRSHGG